MPACAKSISAERPVAEPLLALTEVRAGYGDAVVLDGITLAAVYDLFPRLAERRLSRGNHLSGGEQQMLAIARALMTNPALLLLDEPLEGLAPIIVEELSAAIARMTADEGTAFILVEQHAEVALSLTRDSIVLERGSIVYRACSQQLRS